METIKIGEREFELVEHYNYDEYDLSDGSWEPKGKLNGYLLKPIEEPNQEEITAKDMTHTTEDKTPEDEDIDLKEGKEHYDETDEDEISICKSCGCMTKTINNTCGKCGKNKEQEDEIKIGDEVICINNDGYPTWFTENKKYIVKDLNEDEIYLENNYKSWIKIYRIHFDTQFKKAITISNEKQNDDWEEINTELREDKEGNCIDLIDKDNGLCLGGVLIFRSEDYKFNNNKFYKRRAK